MKKISVVFLGMVLAMGMAMAQKTTWLTQNGTGNLANVTQNAFQGEATSIYATQYGSWNTVNTNQVGTNNYVELMQWGEHNAANMKQATNADNKNNTALIDQFGNSGTANLNQLKQAPLSGPTYDNSINLATATQSGNSNTYALNQGSNEWTPTNTQYLTQTGAGNLAAIVQLGYTDYSEISQSNSWNIANLHQTAGQGGAGTGVSKSTQEGSNNTVNVLQDYDAHSLQAITYQGGATNTTNIDQKSNGLNTVSSQEVGTNDVLNITQIGFKYP